MNESAKKRVSIEINKSYYTHIRYKQESTFALLYYENELPIEILGNILRTSDQLINIDPNHYFIIFKFTNHQQAFKASENLLLDLDNYLNNTRSSIAIDRFEDNQSPTIVINRLIQILNEVKKNPFLRVEDQHVLSDMI